MHLQRFDEAFSFWVDTGPLGTRDDIAPFVGVRNNQIEQIVGELLGLPDDGWTGTAGANVGYILDGKYRYWSSPTRADEVLGAIETTIVLSLLLGEREVLAEQLESARSQFCRYEDGLCDEFRHFETKLRLRLLQ
ncbi:MAG TPA: hypothetical protein PLP42_00085 [Acidobacteriota bacterium]|jgi:hypothetical protein|nr:hypothetical protein [Acidobacteriota bacterium]